MNTLFPEMEAEIREDRKAAKRELQQRARDYLRNRTPTWLLDSLVDKGPQSEMQLSNALMDENLSLYEFDARLLNLFRDLHCLWLVGKLWRKNLGIHPGSGVTSYRFGIRGVHPQI